MVNEPARRCEDDVRILFDCRDLIPHRGATDEHGCAQPDRAADGVQSFVHLYRKFARREDDKTTSLHLRQSLQHGDAERKRFPGAGLRNPNNILAVNERRD